VVVCVLFHVLLCICVVRIVFEYAWGMYEALFGYIALVNT
jgi:hypothetical protein